MKHSHHLCLLTIFILFNSIWSGQSTSDVGSLFPFIQSQATKSDFPLSFLRKEFKNLKPWKQKARSKILDLLHYAPIKPNIDAKVIEKIEKEHYIQEKIIFNTTPNIDVPAYLLIPKNTTLPAPAIIAMHDHGGFYFWGKEKLIEFPNENPTLKNFKKKYYAGNSIASILAEQGYVVIVIDMFYWGERRMILDNSPAWYNPSTNIPNAQITECNQQAGENAELANNTILTAGFTWPGVMLWDDIRTIDYLLTRPEVDKKRIGCLGLSIGGLRAAMLAALDDRIKAAVTVCWMTSFPLQLKNHIKNTIGETVIIPGLYNYLDYPDIISLAMPSALLIIHGNKDNLFEPSGVLASFDKLSSCYKKAGIADKLTIHTYDAPHEFNAQMQQEVWEWLKKWL